MAKSTLIMQWNANGLAEKKKRSLLKALVMEVNADVWLISETHLRAADPLKLPNYHVYRRDETTDTGRAFRGLAILVKKRIVHQPIPHTQLQSIYALGIELCADDDTPIRMFAAYKPPHEKLVVADVHLLLDSPLPTIIAGDLNSKHIAWNSTKICPNGRRLFDDAEREGYEVIGAEVPTHYPYCQTDTPDVIDITIIRGLSPSQITTEVLCESMGSDHHPTLTTVAKTHVIKPPQTTRPRTDWDKYSAFMAQNMTTRPIADQADVDLLTSEVCKTTQEALDQAKIVTGSPSRRRPIPLTVQAMIEKKRSLRKLWQQTRCPSLKSQVNSLAAKISEAVEAVATESWQRTIEEASDDWTSVHRLCRRVSNKPQPIRPLLASDGTPRYRAEDRAEIFADCLEQQFKPNPSDDQAHADEVQRHLDEYFERPIAADEDPIVFTPGQVQRMIRRTKLRKAPGPDRITNEALRHMPPRAIATVTRLFNGIMRTGHFPTAWKLGRVIMLPKPGKNILKPESYRPITLLPTISKVFEKLLLRHLTPHIAPRDEQFGFRAEHSTTLQLTRVLHHMTVASNKGEKTVAVLLDMEKAFDRVWHPGLLYKLSTSTTPRRIVKTVATYLADRRFQVAVEDALSSERKVEAGVPQGSCLSPVCYARYTDDIPLEKGSHLALYADDAAYYSSSMNAKHAAKVIQRTLDALPAWLARWRLSVNVAKTQAITVSQTRLPPPLRLLAQDIEWTPTVKYLGVKIDRRLSMKDHVKETINSARAARALLRPVLYSDLPLKVKLGVYKTYIRPRLTYAAPAWYALISKTRRNQLEAQQSISLRVITKAPRYMRNTTIQKGLRMESLDNFIRHLSKTMFQRVGESTLPHIQELAPHHARPPDAKQLPRDLLDAEASPTDSDTQA